MTDKQKINQIIIDIEAQIEYLHANIKTTDSYYYIDFWVRQIGIYEGMLRMLQQ